jgi:hypothetical protein
MGPTVDTGPANYEHLDLSRKNVTNAISIPLDSNTILIQEALENAPKYD